MSTDKKRSGDKIRLVVPHGKLGTVDIETGMPLAELNKLV
jgi:hypothetical protein